MRCALGGYTAIEIGGAADHRDFDTDDRTICDGFNDLELQVVVAVTRANPERCATLLIGRGGKRWLRLDLLNEKTIRLLGRYNRDRAASVTCRVLLAQPRLLRFAPLLSRALWRKSRGDSLPAGAANPVKKADYGTP